MSDNLAFEVEGSGPALLLVHGLGATGNIWGAQMAALAEHFTVIRPDLRGAGRSSCDGEVSVNNHVDDLIALLDELDVDTAGVAGWSYGGLVVQHLAAAHPSRVNALSLLGPVAAVHAPLRDDKRAAALLARADAVRAGGLVSVADVTVGRGTAAETKAQRPEVAAFVRELVMRQDPEGYAKTCEAIANSSATPAEAIKCPVLFVAGDQDATAPAAGVQAQANAITGAKYQLLSACGHWHPIEKPVEVTKALQSFHTNASSV